MPRDSVFAILYRRHTHSQTVEIGGLVRRDLTTDRSHGGWTGQASGGIAPDPPARGGEPVRRRDL